MAKIYKNFPYPINAGASKTVDINTKTVSFGDGYEQTFSFGINNTSISWQCSKTDTETVINEIEAFILSHKNVDPFYMTIRGQKKLYKVVGGLQSTQDSGDMWTISFNVKQSFDL